MTVKAEPFGSTPNIAASATRKGKSRIAPSDYHTGPSTSTRNARDELRQARSGAPSVEAGFQRQATLHQEAATENHNRDDEEVVLMKEIRAPVTDCHQTKQGVMDRLHQELPPNASFVSRGFEVIGAKLKKLNDTLGDLQAMGVDHVTNLPEVVLVGDQSSGKSSLMSAFSGIYLPRSEGVCTRCPVHIRLSQSETWSCRISIQQEYDYDSRLQPQPNRNRKFGPWIEPGHGSVVIKNFCTITDSNDPQAIEEAIRWAQLAILNPDDDHALYRPESGGKWRHNNAQDDPQGALRELENTTMASFSPNRVGLEVSGPRLPDLSFFDLPGCFQATHHASQDYLVDMIDNLVDHYISQQRAIVLCAIPMNADPENSKTLRRIRKANASGRTVGVLTKADLLSPNNSSQQWISMLKRERFQEIGYGYFITARPSVSSYEFSDENFRELHDRRHQNADRPGIQSAIGDLERQGAYEESFFNGTLQSHSGPEWPTERFREFHDRCGVSQLSIFVSSQLGREFEKELPNITTKLSSRLQQIEAALVDLPDEPLFPEVGVRDSLRQFINRANATLGGSERTEEWRRMIDDFRKEVFSLKPKFKVGVRQQPIDLTVDDDPVTPQPKRRHGDCVVGTPSNRTPMPKRACSGNGVKNERGSEPAIFAIPRRMAGVPSPSPISPNLLKSRHLSEIRQIIEAHSRPGMPGLVSPDAHNLLCTGAVKPWDGPLSRLINKTRAILNAEIREILQQSFSGMQHRHVYKAASQHMQRFVDEQIDSMEDLLMRSFKVETKSIYTLDTMGQARYQELEAKILHRSRHFFRWQEYLGKDKAADLAPLKELKDMSDEERAQEEVRMGKEGAKLGPDPFKRELEVCAYVRGYYLLAATRFTEVVCLHINSGLLPEVMQGIDDSYLDKQLGLVGNHDPTVSYEDRFKKLMEEDQATADARRKYKQEKERLEKAQDKIRALEDGPSDDHASNPDTDRDNESRSPITS